MSIEPIQMAECGDEIYVRYSTFEEREKAARLAIEEGVGNGWQSEYDDFFGCKIYLETDPIPDDVFDQLRQFVQFDMCAIGVCWWGEYKWALDTLTDAEAARRRMRGVFGVARFSLDKTMANLETEFLAVAQ
jgi:hypothetical protein